MRSRSRRSSIWRIGQKLDVQDMEVLKLKVQKLKVQKMEVQEPELCGEGLEGTLVHNESP